LSELPDANAKITLQQHLILSASGAMAHGLRPFCPDLAVLNSAAHLVNFRLLSPGAASVNAPGYHFQKANASFRPQIVILRIKTGAYAMAPKM